MAELLGLEGRLDGVQVHIDADAVRGDSLATHLRTLLVTRLRSLGVPAQETEDLAQQCLIEIYETLQRYDSGRGSLDAWAAGIARNVARNWRRAQSRRTHEPLEESALKPLATSLVGEGSVAAVSEALSGLNIIDRELLNMRFALGMSFAEIEQQTDLTEANARKRVSRAIESLRRHPSVQAMLS
jgi:RNA polymerase sigma-70 factor (ECF subfamily)